MRAQKKKKNGNLKLKTTLNSHSGCATKCALFKEPLTHSLVALNLLKPTLKRIRQKE